MQTEFGIHFRLESCAVVCFKDLRMNETYLNVYITWMYLVFMYVLPFGGLSVLNSLMYLDVRRSNARQVWPLP